MNIEDSVMSLIKDIGRLVELLLQRGIPIVHPRYGRGKINSFKRGQHHFAVDFMRHEDFKTFFLPTIMDPGLKIDTDENQVFDLRQNIIQDIYDKGLNLNYINGYVKGLIDKDLKKQKEKEYEKQKQVDFNRKKSVLDELGIKYLFHLTHLSNLKSILEQGILSENQLIRNTIRYKSIADQKIKERRKNIFNYVPLFFSPRNPMLYRFFKQDEKLYNSLFYLKIDSSIMASENVWFTDGNAASRDTSFYDDIDSLRILNWGIIRGNSWTGVPDGKRIRGAEVLALHAVNCKYIKEICAKENGSLQKLPNDVKILAQKNNIAITKCSSCFF